MKSRIAATLILIFTSLQLSATHNRGAKIEARFLQGFTYRIFITTYTKTSSVNVDRPSLDSVYMGDGSIEIFQRSQQNFLSNDVTENIYWKEHVYPGFGTYLIYFIDPNRNHGIINIPNSVDHPLAVQAEIVLAQNTCPVNSPVFLCRPVFSTAMNKDVTASFAAYSEDHDSISYSLVPCHGAGNLEIPGYFLPPGVSLNAYSGELKWDHNQMTMDGNYNFVVRADQWRNGNYFGHSMIDFSLELENTLDTNYNFLSTATFPVSPQGFFTSTIAAGSVFDLPIQYVDGASPYVDLFSGPLNSLLFGVSAITDTCFAFISWTTTLSDASNQPYTFVLRGMPSGKDLTYLVYVTGNSSDSCNSWIGIDDMESESSLSVFPNPAKNILNVFFNETIDPKGSVTMISLQGETIFKSMANDKMTIDLTGLATGIYFLRYESQAKIVFKKIIVN